ncbi:MAG: hypothetical protein ACREUJ_07620 [Burkholderiales bacterium]
MLSLLAFVRKHRGPGIALALASASALLWNFLFYPGSSFTQDWETDSPLNVAFDYQPLGFLAANVLPAITNISLVVALALFLRRRS